MRHTSRSSSLPPGISLIEMLIVVGISVFVVASLGGAMNGLRRTDEVKQAALQFQSMVAEASRIARMERAPTRIVFMLPENIDDLEQAGVSVDNERFQPACRILLFKVPGRHLSATIHLPPLDGAPPVPMARLPRFETMVGRWQPAPNHPTWRRWHHSTMIAGELVDDWNRGGIRHCAPLYQINPPERWSAEEQGANHPLAVYPQNLELSPFETRLESTVSALPDIHTIRIKGMPPKKVSDLYQENPIPHWIRQDHHRFDQAPPDESLPLPAIDFNEDGSLATRGVEVLRFHFSEAENTRARWTVHVRTRDAHTWIE